MTDACCLARCEQSLFPLKIRREEHETSKHPSVTLSVTCERRSFARHAQCHARTPCFEFFPTDFQGTERENARCLFGVLENVVVNCVLHLASVFFNFQVQHSSSNTMVISQFLRSNSVRWLSRYREETSIVVAPSK